MRAEKRLRGVCSHVALLTVVAVGFMALHGRATRQGETVERTTPRPPVRTRPLTVKPDESVEIGGPQVLLGAMSTPAQDVHGNSTFEQHMRDLADEGPGVEAAERDTFWDRWGLDITVDWVSAYYFRGVLLEDSGFILQPAVELSFDLTKADSDLGVYAFAGVWNSFHSEATDADTSDSFRQYWYEIDYYFGLTFEYDAWAFTAEYYFFDSPSNAFDLVQEAVLTLGYDDSACWENGFAVNPEMLIAFETGDNFATGEDRGIYLQLGVTPTFPLTLFEREFELGLPVLLGLSLDDYFQDDSGADDTFGFFQAGTALSTQLGDNTTLYGRVDWLYLGDNLTELNDGDPNEVIGTIGVGFSF